MTATVIAFPGSRSMNPDRENLQVAEKLISAALCEQEIARIAPPKVEKLTSEESRKAQLLSWVDQIRALIEQDRIVDFLFVGRDTETKHFLTEIAISPSHESEKLFAFLGITDALKLEITERAQLSPSLQPDGTVLDPYYEAI